MASRGSRGIYLISTLLLLTFLVMLGGAIAVSFQQGLASSGNFNNRQVALNAAMSGLQYIQARLESNPSVYGPGYSASANPEIVANSNLSVREKQDSATRALNICGYMNNAAVEGGESQVHVMFRASFNGSYTAFAAAPSDWSFVNFGGASWNSALGTMHQVSMNNLLRSSQLSAGSSYTHTGTAYKQVAGGTADIIVEGLVVRADGVVVARRSVESVYRLTGAQSPNAPGAATAALDMNITLYQGEASGGGLSVGVGPGVNASMAANAGLAAFNGDITLNGEDAATQGAPPPGYTSTSRASVQANKAFKYNWADGAQSQTYSPSSTDQTVVQAQSVQPPDIAVSNLPLQQNPVNIAAGTWVVWNGNLYHYATDYDPTVPLIRQDWQGGTGGNPPTLNGVTGQVQSLPSGLTFNSTSNTMTISSDVLVNAGAGGTNSFAFVVAPTDNQPNGNGTVNSAEVGSAQVVFDASTGLTPQFRSPGSLAVVGNVTGQGAMVATGEQGTNTGNVTVIGKSALDTRSDSGVALYATGSVNVQQLSFGQAPQSVPAVKNTLGNLGIQAGGGTDRKVNATNITDRNQAIFAAITQAMQAKMGSLQDDFDVIEMRDNGATMNMVKIPSEGYGIFADAVKDQKVTLTYNGTTINNKPLKEALRTISEGNDTLHRQFEDDRIRTSLPSIVFSGNGLVRSVTQDGVTTSTTLVPPINIQSGFTQGSNRYFAFGSRQTWNISSTDWGNYQTTGTSEAADAAAVTSPNGTSGTTSGGSTGGSTATPSGGVTTAALNQSFSGLVYAGRDVNIHNGLGSITVNGMVAAFGGDPNTQSAPSPGGGGSINLSGNSVSLMYDPSTLGPYLYLFGGVKLQVNSLANF